MNAGSNRRLFRAHHRRDDYVGLPLNTCMVKRQRCRGRQAGTLRVLFYWYAAKVQAVRAAGGQRRSVHRQRGKTRRTRIYLPAPPQLFCSNRKLLCCLPPRRVPGTTMHGDGAAPGGTPAHHMTLLSLEDLESYVAYWYILSS